MIKKLETGKAWTEDQGILDRYDGDCTTKPPIITAANQVASGLIFSPVASAQPKLISPGPATHVKMTYHQWQSIAARRSQKKLTADTFDSPPDTKQCRACQEPSVDLALFGHPHRTKAIEQGGEWDCADGKVRKRRIECRVGRCQQERKYTPRVGKVRQAQRERKPERAAERDCLARVGSHANHARGGEGRNESRDTAGEKGATVCAQ